MSDGTGTDPSTDRCPDCGHLLDRECGCFCCGPDGDPGPVGMLPRWWWHDGVQ